jgi:hypothetical protein
MRSLPPLMAVNPIPTIEAPASCCEGEGNQQDEEDDEHYHDGFPFWTHRVWVGATLHVGPCRIALFSFTHVNYFLLLVYLAKPQSASYERMRYADESNIIRIDEEGKRTQVMRMQTGYEGGRPQDGKRIRTDVRLFR